MLRIEWQFGFSGWVVFFFFFSLLVVVVWGFFSAKDLLTVYKVCLRK